MRARLLRRPLPELYTLMVLGDLIWLGSIPLAPEYKAHLSLSATALGALVASTSLAVGLVSLPAGLASDRIGAHRVAAIGGVLMAVGTGLMTAIDSYLLLVVGRAVLGLGHGLLWVAGSALIAGSTAPEKRDRALSRLILLAGIGSLVGPGAAGLAVERFGLAAPFAALAAVCALATAVLVARPVSTSSAMDGAGGMRELVGSVRRNRFVAAGLLTMAMPAFVLNGAHLAIPLDLAARGWSAGDVGLLFAVAAVLFSTASFVVSRRSERLTTIEIATGGAACLTLLYLLPLATADVVALSAFVLVRAPVAATLFATSLPLAVRGAEQAGVGSGAVLGLTNVVWACATVVSPIVTGALLDLGGRRPAYAFLLIVGACMAVVLGRQRERTAATAQPQRSLP